MGYSTEVTFYNVPFDINYTHCFYPGSNYAPYTDDTVRSPANVSRMLKHYVITSAGGAPSTAVGSLTWINSEGVGDGTIRLESTSSYLANYIKIENSYTTSNGAPFTATITNRGAIYAFITGIKRINANTIEVSFTVDVMMSYYATGRVDMADCFIERQTVYNDFIGAHIEPETVPIGELVSNSQQELTPWLSGMAICAALYIPHEGETVSGQLTGGIFSGASIRAFPATTEGVSKLNEMLEVMVEAGKESNVYLYMAPAVLWENQPGCTTNDDGTVTIPSGGVVYESTVTPFRRQVQLDSTLGLYGADSSLDGYIPNNNKLYTYPYNYLHVSNNNGGGIDLRYEYMDFGYAKGTYPTSSSYKTSNWAGFEIDGTPLNPVTFSCRPTGYGGSGGYQTPDINLSLSDYPMCSWAADSFKRWVAHNTGTIAFTTISSIASIGLGAVTLGMAPEIASAASSLGSEVGADAIAKKGASQVSAGSSSLGSLLPAAINATRQGDYIGGTMATGNLLATSDLMTFTAARKTLKYETAKMIDDYFTLYGYNVSTIGNCIPNNRAYFDYIKTRNAQAVHPTGALAYQQYGAPAEAYRIIESVFNRGVWFIHDSYGDDGWTMGSIRSVNPMAYTQTTTED